jgi:HlyD family secretion protein
MIALLRRYYLRLILLTLVLAIAALVVVHRLRGPQVPVAAVTRNDLRQTVVASGRVLAPARVKLGGLVLARVQRVLVEEGQRVKQGQLLVQLDDADAMAALAQARAEVARARAQLLSLRRVSSRLSRESVRRARLALDEAQKELARQRELVRSGAAADIQLERAQRAEQRARSNLQTATTQALDKRRGGSAYLVAAANLKAAEAAARRAEVALSRLQITAPGEGLVVARLAEPGDVVSAGKTLLELTEVGRQRILMEPDERNLALLAVGQKGRASADAHPDRPFPVTVETIVPVVDRASGTFRVKLAVDRPPDFLVSDMTVSVEIEVARRTSALSVPRAAVRDLASRRPWALMLLDGRAVKRPLRLGITGERRVEVLEGLSAGERVLLATERAVLPGDRVRPITGGGAQER